jgi:hypothetical protein
VVPLVVEVNSADIMATLLILKAEAEERWGTNMRMVFSGATEAHLLAEEIGTLTSRVEGRLPLIC